MPVKIHRPPQLAVFCLGLLIGLLVVSLLLIPSSKVRELKAQNDYGQTLAAMTAKRVVDASFNNDLVRLQVVLHDLVSHPHIVQATIHDIENTLLVQAGEARPDKTSHTAYSASIVLHDSMSGYVTLTLQNFSHASSGTHLFLVLTAIALSLCCALSLYFSGTLEWTRPTSTKASKLSSENPTVDDGEPSGSSTDDGIPAEVKAEDETDLVYAVIHIKNCEVLKQQLNTETWNTTLGKLENIISDVIALYNGDTFERENNHYILRFKANDAANEAIFRASCSAFLIVELASIINKIPLDLASFVSANKEDLVPAKLPVAGLVIEAVAAQDELIQRRLHFMEVGTDDGRMIVANFEQPYSTLLESQRKHLSQLPN